MAIFTNQATLSYNSSVTTSNITTGELLEVLSVSKTAAETDYTAQDTVTYVVSITNGGSAAFSGLTVTDDLGGYSFDGGTVYPLSYVDGSLLYYVNGVLVAVSTNAKITARRYRSPKPLRKTPRGSSAADRARLTFTIS